MAQTVTLQRGSFTVTSGSSATMFTNPAGVIASRVIINSILITTSTSTGTSGKFSGNVGGALVVTPTGQGTYVLGSAIAPTSAFFLQFPTAYNSVQPLSHTVGTSTSFLYGTTLISHGSGLNASFTSGSATKSATTDSPSNIGGFPLATNCPLAAPQNFWIGPNDAVKFNTTTSISRTVPGGKASPINYVDSVTVFYSFTLINEV